MSLPVQWRGFVFRHFSVILTDLKLNIKNGCLMMNDVTIATNPINVKKDWQFYGFAILLGFAYFWGVVSFQHYIPSGADFHVSLYVMLIASTAMLLGFWRVSIVGYSHNVIAWVVFFVLMLLQPVFNKMFYLDDHLLLCMLFLWCAMLAVLVKNLNAIQKQRSVHCVAIFVLLAGICTVLSQLGQLFFREQLSGILIFEGLEDRLIGNVAQVNQAAYVATLGMAGVFYFLYKINRLTWWHRAIAVGLMCFFGLGLGLSASRGGLLLGIAALLSGGIFYKATFKRRLLMGLSFFPVAVVGYQIGTWLMNTYQRDDLSAIGRWVGEQSLHMRGDLLEHALMAFKSSPITGVGFGNFKAFGLERAEEVPWFTVVHHAHNLIAQIGAEMGLIGLTLLGYFAFILLKNLRFDLSPDKGFAYAMLMLAFLYSLSEFPLWYVRYLLLTVFFLSIIDDSDFSIKVNIQKIGITLSLLFVLASAYYIKDYRIYSSIAYKVIGGEKEVALERFKDAPKTFGFGAYRDLTAYQIIPASEENLEQMIKMGERVLTVHYDDYLILKQTHMLIAVGEQDKADAYFRALCLFSRGSFCQEVIDSLHNLVELDPANQGYYERFEKWYVAKFDKPMPSKSKDIENE